MPRTVSLTLTHLLSDEFYWYTIIQHSVDILNYSFYIELHLELELNVCQNLVSTMY